MKYREVIISFFLTPKDLAANTDSNFVAAYPKHMTNIPWMRIWMRNYWPTFLRKINWTRMLSGLLGLPSMLVRIFTNMIPDAFLILTL